MHYALDLDIRPCTERDMDAVLVLATEYEYSKYQAEEDNLKSPSEDSDGWNECAKTVESSMLRGCDIYVAVEKEKVVGFVAGYTDDYFKGYGILYSLYVQRGYRNMGIGSALLDEIECYFAKQNCRKMQAMIDPDDEDALEFSRRQGYYESYLTMKKSIRKNR